MAVVQKQTKKGSLSLSINAIVVLIMAIAMLGVGIFFISNVLDDGLGTLGSIPDSVRASIEDMMRQTGAKLYVDGLRDNTLNIPLRGDGSVTVATNNQREGVGYYAIQIEALRSWDSDGQDTTGLGIGYQGLTIRNIDDIDADADAELVEIGGYGMQTINFNAGNNRGRTLYRVTIWVADEPDTGSVSHSDFEVYSQQTFYVRVQ